jgi:hypothetical protein
MAVRACGYSAGFLLPKFSADNALVDVFDARMTLHARGGDVAPGNRGFRFGVGKDQVAAMATGAGRRYGQALFEQTLAVDTLAVVLDDVVLGNPVGARHRRPLAVAAPARVGDPHLIGGGCGVRDREYVVDVCARVAINAAGSVRVVTIERLSVDTRIEVQLDIVVAVAAIDARESLLVRKIFDIGILMTVYAVQLAVNGLQEYGILDVKRDFFAASHGFQLGVVVTIETRVVINSPERKPH